MTCPHCGKEVHNGANFCRFCGNRVYANAGTTAGHFCPVCGAVPPAGAKFCNKCGNPLSRQPAAIQPQMDMSRTPARTARNAPAKPKRRFSGFIRSVAFLLVAALLVTGLWKPGFMLPWFAKIGITKPADPKVAYNTDVLVLDRKEIDRTEPDTFALNMDETVAVSGNVTVDLGTLDGEHTLEIRDVGKKHDNAEDASVYVYDFRIDGGKTQPEGYVKITVPYDPANTDPLDTITVRHFDEKEKTWTILPAEFDTEAKTVTFWTDHFSPDGVYDTSESRVAFAGYLDGSIAGGTLDLPPEFEEYKQDGTGFDLGGAGQGAAIGGAVVPPGLNSFGAAAGFYIGGKMAEWNNDEAFLYNQTDVQEGKGALSRVTFNANRLVQISKRITTQFDTLRSIAKQEHGWEDDPTTAGKAAVVTGVVGNAATTGDNIQQILSSMGKIAEGTSGAISKVFFAAGAVLTAVKFGATWYENGDFTGALWDNAADIGVLALGGISLATGGTAGVAVGIVAGALWAVTAIGGVYQNYDADRITALRNGHYDNDTQRTYMYFTKGYISYSAQAEQSGKWPGGIVFSQFPEKMQKTRDYIFNTYKTNGFSDSVAFGNPQYDPQLSRWKTYLRVKAYSNSTDTGQLAENIDACFANAAGVFWKLPAEVRREFAKDIGATGYSEPDPDTVGVYKEQMKQVLAMMNTGNIKYFYEQYRTKAMADALKSIEELTEAMNTVSSFSFYVTEPQQGGKPKKIPLAESQYKGYIAAFCTGEKAAPRNAAYGTVDDWIFKIGSDTVQFQCTAYNWLKASGRESGQGGAGLNYIRLFKDEKALKYNESAAEASFEFANGGIEVVFGETDDIEGTYTGTITPTGVYLGDLWYKVWGEQFGLSREDCDDSVSMSDGLSITGLTIEKGGILSGGKYKLSFHMVDGEGDKVTAKVDAAYKNGELVIKNDKGTTSIRVIREPGKPIRLAGTGVVINFDQVRQAFLQMYLIVSIDAVKQK